MHVLWALFIYLNMQTVDGGGFGVLGGCSAIQLVVRERDSGAMPLSHVLASDYRMHDRAQLIRSG